MSRLLPLVLLPLALLFAGCAAQYHAWPGACVSYGYRIPPPLPWSLDAAPCPTPVAARWAPAAAEHDRPAPLAEPADE